MSTSGPPFAAAPEPEDPATQPEAGDAATANHSAPRAGARRSPSRRERFLARIEPVWDGPVLLVTRIAPIDRRRSRAAADVGLILRGVITGGGLIACWIAAAVTHDGASSVIAGGIAALALFCPPLHRAVNDWSAARHGFKYRYLTVRTWTGRRSLNLAQLVLVLEEGEATTAMDAKGIVVSTANRSARRAIAQCAQRWGLGEAPPTPAATRRLAWFAFSRNTRAGRLLRNPAAKLLCLAGAVGICALLR
jgi:hypothetical protein